MLAIDGDEITIGILNPDGSHAEMSGNGTRIAAAWLMSRNGRRARGSASVSESSRCARVADGLYESELGVVEVFTPEIVAGVELTPVSVGNPHAVVLGDPDRIGELGPLLETHSRFPRANERAGRAARRAGRGNRAGLGARRGGDEPPRERAPLPSPQRHTASGEVLVHFPGGDLRVRLDGGRAWLTGPAEPLADPA